MSSEAKLYELPYGYSHEKLLDYNEMIEDNWRGVELLTNKQYEEAEKFYNAMLAKFFSKQALEEDRYHKGTPYHNLALALAAQGKLRDGAKNFVLAYIEDMLTFGEKVSEILPAVRALKLMGMFKNYLLPVRDEILSLKGKSVQNPERIYLKFQKSFDEPPLQNIDHDDLVELISTENAQNLSLILRFHTRQLDSRINNVLSCMNKDRYIVWAALFTGIVSLVLAIVSLLK